MFRALKWLRHLLPPSSRNSRPGTDTPEARDIVRPVMSAGSGLVDPTWYFKEFLPRSFPQSSVSRMIALSTTMRFVITGDRETHWTCRFEKGRLVGVSEGRNGDVEDFGYRMTLDGFTAIVTGNASLQELFFRGEGDMFGDVETALKMVPVLREFVKEFPVVLP